MQSPKFRECHTLLFQSIGRCKEKRSKKERGYQSRRLPTRTRSQHSHISLTANAHGRSPIVRFALYDGRLLPSHTRSEHLEI